MRPPFCSRRCCCGTAAAPASADTVIWTGEVHVEKWASGRRILRLLVVGYRDIPGPRQFWFDGISYTVNLFYITNTPRSLLAGTERRILPTDRGLAWLVDGQRFELADHDRNVPRSGRGDMGQLRARLGGRQVVSVQLVQAATPVPATAGSRRRSARPGAARQGVEAMTR